MISHTIQVGYLTVEYLGHTIGFPFEDEYGNETGEWVEGILTDYSVKSGAPGCWVTIEFTDPDDEWHMETFYYTAEIEVL